MSMIVNCSNCRTRLQVQRATTTSIRCLACCTVTRVVRPCPPTPSPCRKLGVVTPPPLVHQRKKAVVVGITYKGQPKELKGCINDARMIRNMLINTYKYPESCVVMLTEEEKDPNRIPTKRNIQVAMRWLVQGCTAGDSLVFYFSGHGDSQVNHTGGERDRKDETIVPLDFERNGQIIDDEINNTIVRPLTRGVKLHAIIDACHSGTVLDLAFLCQMNREGHYEWEDHRPKSGKWMGGTSGGEAISFSGCDDHQLSDETNWLAKVAYTGAMTFALVTEVEWAQGPITYGNILAALRSTMLSAGKDQDGNYHLPQEPQLCANEWFNIYTKPFAL